MTSVVIAAHNEAAVIGGLLTALTKNRGEGDFDIVVVCNGCSDDTADIARSFGSPVRVAETEVASKPHALNLGDEIARGFPRIYVDADILVNSDIIMALAVALQSGQFLAAGVSPQIDTCGCSAGVKAFYAIKDKLPSSREGIAGSGLYALSEAGRARFGRFPDIVSEDLFIRLLFKETERTTLPGLHSVVFAAKNVRALMIQRTRSSFGSGQLARLYPKLLENNAASNNKALLALFKKPSLWLKLSTYVYVTLKARQAARRLAREAAYVWAREQTSRMKRDPSINIPREAN
jgi:hypothetical protein